MAKYKLIKKYPGSPKLNTIVKESEYRIYYINLSTGEKYSKDQIENYPEFWEKVVEKDYEILSLLNHINGTLINNKHKDFDLLRDTNFETISIHSVKRLSDGEVFTVGDKIKGYPADNGFIIKYIWINDVNTIVLADYDKNSKGSRSTFLENAIELKKPLFTTEDGVDVYEGDEVYYVKDFVLSWAIIPNYYKHVDGRKYFSTKEAAEEYILMNKPCLSINDVEKWASYSKCNLINELVRIVKSKL